MAKSIAEIKAYKASTNFDDDIVEIFLGMMRQAKCRLPFEPTHTAAKNFVEKNINAAIYEYFAFEGDAGSFHALYSAKQQSGQQPNFPDSFSYRLRQLAMHAFEGEREAKKSSRTFVAQFTAAVKLILFRK